MEGGSADAEIESCVFDEAM